MYFEAKITMHFTLSLLQMISTIESQKLKAHMPQTNNNPMIYQYAYMFQCHNIMKLF